jgi:hypothetical protein
VSLSPECRAAGPHPAPLTELQAQYLSVIAQMHAITGSGCQIGFLARHFAVHYETARETVGALARKGWLEDDVTPVKPRHISST